LQVTFPHAATAPFPNSFISHTRQDKLEQFIGNFERRFLGMETSLKNIENGMAELKK
jgi:hypothetical protein